VQQNAGWQRRRARKQLGAWCLLEDGGASLPHIRHPTRSLLVLAVLTVLTRQPRSTGRGGRGSTGRGGERRSAATAAHAAAATVARRLCAAQAAASHLVLDRRHAALHLCQRRHAARLACRATCRTIRAAARPRRMAHGRKLLVPLLQLNLQAEHYTG
jgi:hypothetical protein